MRLLSSYTWLCLAVICAGPGRVWGEKTGNAPVGPVPPPRIEPGLESAIKWKWWVVPSDEKQWGIPLPEDEAPKAPEAKPGVPGTNTPTITTVHIVERPTTYEVKKGDALILIAKKFNMKVPQLKAFNGMTDDLIRAGQTLRIPTLEELKTLQPPPPPPAPEKKPDEPKPEEKKDKKGKKKKEEVKPEASPEVMRELENVLMQVYLDREHFSVGPIDGKSGALMVKVAQLYQTSHAEVGSTDVLKAKAKEVVGTPYTSYFLKPEDYRYISPPKALRAGPETKGAKTPPKTRAAIAKQDAAPPPLTYEELLASPFLGYRTAWEFVAERYHCDEAYLRRLNSGLKGRVAAGTEFKVPNVIPFEVEKAFASPLQPAANPDKPVTAAIVEMSRMEIYEGPTLVAVMPVASALPDLRGRGTWTVLDVIPHPRMATKQEVKEAPKAKVSNNLLITGTEPAIPVAAPVAMPPLDHEVYLPPGPDNPVGILWINLAKAKSTDPLPFGLHGTSIPGQMNTQRGIGGIRLANWNIARAARLLPPGTPLQWKAH